MSCISNILGLLNSNKMKCFLLILLVGIGSTSWAQNYTVTYTQLRIISYSVNITYVNNQYKAPSNYQGTLNTMQARYDYYYSMVNTAWGKVRDCELINKVNNGVVRRHDREIESYLKPYSRVDWARNGDAAIKIRNWILSVFDLQNIKTEIQVLQAINKEYNRLKRSYPDDFHKRDRYFELGKVLKLIETCSPNEVGDLGMQYGLF